MSIIFRTLYGTACFFLCVVSAMALHLPSDDGINPLHGQAHGKLRSSAQPADSIHDEMGRPLYFVQLADEPGIFAAMEVRTADRNSAMKPGAPAKRLAAAINSTAVSVYRTTLSRRQDEVLSEARKLTGRDIDAVSRHDLLLNGFTAYLGKHEAEALRGLPGVKNVGKVAPRYLDTDHGPAFIGARSVWEGLDGATQARGEGVIVGIIDSGIDPTHPSFADVSADGYDHENPLGAGVYLGDCEKSDYRHLCNDKLIGIVSYPEITRHFAPRHDPVGYDLVGHGTHVASIAAGNELHDVPVYDYILGEASDFSIPRISGVAPRANVVAYQVCHPIYDGNGQAIEGGPCLTNFAVASLEHAMEYGVDVINYSIGGAPGDPWIAMDALAFLNARTAGLHAATSAGNEGPYPSTIRGPGNAPWITTVAAATHDRIIEGKQLTNFSGGLDTPPDMAGAGLSGSVRAPVVKAADYGDAQCFETFPANTFDGEIVVCERGIGARIDKGRNLRDAGAGGMILLNTEFGFADLVEDPHLLPAIHLSYEDGVVLLDWLAGGVDHVAEITASALGSDPTVGDVIPDFSARGPNQPYTEIPAIHVTAPGVNVFGAYSIDTYMMDSAEPEMPFNFLSGTSMASPHVAGALALIVERHPDWTPAEAQSALMMTAAPEAQVLELQSSGERVPVPADLDAQGAGSVRVDRAVNAGLVLDIDRAEYEAANPQQGGALTELNFPALLMESCVFRCVWTREFRATRDASWAVELDGAAAGVSLTASPAMFALNAGEKVTVEFTFEISPDVADAQHDASVHLVPVDPELPVLRLPLRITAKLGEAPERFEIVAHRNAARFEIPGIRSFGTADDLQITVQGIAAGQRHIEQTREDSTPDMLYDDWSEPWHWVEVEVERSTRYLSASIVAAEAPDLDLYCSFDKDADGHHDIIEMLNKNYSASSTGPDSNEFCEFFNPEAGRYFIGVHNYAGANEAGDEHELEIQLVAGTDEGNLVFEPVPAFESPEPYALSARWDVELAQGDPAAAIVTLGTTPEAPDNIGNIVLHITRGENDVQLQPGSTLATTGKAIGYTLSVIANESTAERVYDISLELPQDVALVQQDGSAMVDGRSMRWRIVQPAGAAAAMHTFSVRTPDDLPHYDLELAVEHELSEAGFVSGKETSAAPSVAVEPAPPSSGGGGMLGWLLLPLACVGFCRRFGRRKRPVTAMLALCIAALAMSGCGGDGAAPNRAPTVSLPAPDGDVWERDTVTLLANASDPDNDSLTYSWEQLSGPAVNLEAGDAAMLEFIAPDIADDAVEDVELGIRVTVQDAEGETTSDDILLAVRNRWANVDCEYADGSGYIGLSTDGGTTLRAVEQPDSFTNAHTGGLVALNTPGLLLAAYVLEGFEMTLLRSRDSGCTWDEIGSDPSISFPTLTVAGGDRAYVWDWFSGNYLVVDAQAEPGEVITRREFPFRQDCDASPNRPAGMGVLESDPDEIVVMGKCDSDVWYSHDGGESWEPGGFYKQEKNQLIYAAAFDPTDLRHIVLGVSHTGTHVSFDGGDTWQRSVINTASVGGDVMGYEVKFVPGLSDVLWLNGRDLDESDGYPDIRSGKRIYRSMDGGLTFDSMLHMLEDDVIIVNGNVSAAVPGNPDVYYFTHFSCATPVPDDSGREGNTWLYRYDAATDTVTGVWDAGMEGIQSIEFSPRDARVMWFGLNLDPRC